MLLERYLRYLQIQIMPEALFRPNLNDTYILPWYRFYHYQSIHRQRLSRYTLQQHAWQCCAFLLTQKPFLRQLTNPSQCRIWLSYISWSYHWMRSLIFLFNPSLIFQTYDPPLSHAQEGVGKARQLWYLHSLSLVIRETDSMELILS